MADGQHLPVLKNTLALVLAGGQGERMYPLTRDRAKAAVPFGGIYRIIDFTLSNCVNSGIRKCHILTQYKSLSLDRHLAMGWNIFNYELGEFITTIPPQQRTSSGWYRGTADAVFQNIYTLQQEKPRFVLILSCDHIYKMDYAAMLTSHVRQNADVTVAAMEVPIEEGKRLGVLEVGEEGRIAAFKEKPEDPTPSPQAPERCLASMGVYAFNTDVLVRAVSQDAKRDSSHDFGQDVIPALVETHNVFAHRFCDPTNAARPYWRDIGTIDAYWEANMDLVAVTPEFNLYDRDWPIRTYQEQHPPAKTVLAEGFPGGRSSRVVDSIISGGCIISGGAVERSVLSYDVRVEERASVRESILFEGVQIGAGAQLERVIVDKGVVVPAGERIGCTPNEDRRRFKVTERGVVVAPKEAAWPSRTQETAE